MNAIGTVIAGRLILVPPRRLPRGRVWTRCILCGDERSQRTNNLRRVPPPRCQRCLPRRPGPWKKRSANPSPRPV